MYYVSGSCSGVGRPVSNLARRNQLGAVPSFIEMFNDIRFGIRMLRRSPGFSLLAVLCLTLGIGATTSVFSWIEGILLRPFPAVANQDRLVAMAGTDRNGRTDVSWPDFQDFEKNCTGVEAFIAEHIFGTTLSIGDRADRATGSVVSANYFQALGIRPILGRTFDPSEDVGRNAHPVTVISYQAWKRSLPRRSGDHRQNADDEWRAAHHHRRDAGGIFWHFRGLFLPLLGSGFDGGSV